MKARELRAKVYVLLFVVYAEEAIHVLLLLYQIMIIRHCDAGWEWWTMNDATWLITIPYYIVRLVSYITIYMYASLRACRNHMADTVSVHHMTLENEPCYDVIWHDLLCWCTTWYATVYDIYDMIMRRGLAWVLWYTIWYDEAKRSARFNSGDKGSSHPYMYI